MGKAQLALDIPAHKKERDEAKQAMKEATALREKEAKAFAEESLELGQNMDAARKAIAALEKGAYGAFLQTSAANVLRSYMATADLEDTDRDMLTAFLTQGEGYVPQSGQVIGMLKQMTDTMDKHLKEITEIEEKAKAD